MGIAFDDDVRAQEFLAAARGLAANGHLVTEPARFTGAELVYANLDAATTSRIKSALDA